MMLNSAQKKAYLDYIFYRTRDKIKVHGLGMSSIKPCETYPFASVDSTTWLQWQKFGASRAVPDEVMRKWMSRHTHYEERNEKEIRWYLLFERRITKLWAHRGIKWDDYDELMAENCDFSNIPVKKNGLPIYRYNESDRRFDEPSTVISR